MKRTAKVALVTPGKENANRLGMPEFGVAKLYLSASGKNSQSYLQEGARPPEKETKGSDDFHFAPGPQLAPDTWAADGSKTDKVAVAYELYNPYACVKEAKLELFRRFKDAPVWTRQLKGDELLDGEHKLEFDGKPEWDGKIGTHADFPDEYVTVEHSPYKLRLTVKGEGLCVSPVAWTYFHVLVAKLELEYGPEKVLPASQAGKADHRKVLQALVTQNAKPPAPGGKAKVFLESNRFKKGHSMFDNSLYTVYESLWGKGPQIPLFAKVFAKSSDDKAVVAHKALGKVKFLWDWESKSAATGETFTDRAQDYHKDTTKPKGQNCHKDRGGKRGEGADPVFPAQAGYNPKDALDDEKFPFKVEACPDPRKWAAYSYAWGDKKLASKTGVVFQPARTAGDLYDVTVHVACNVDGNQKPKINTDDDPPLKVHDSLKVSTGSFEVWRKVHVVKYLRKKAGVPQLSMATISGCYPVAFMDVDVSATNSTTMSKADWNTAFTTAMTNLGWNDIDKLAVDGTVDQYDQGNYGAYFRNRLQFREAWILYEINRRLTGVNAGVASQAAQDVANTAGAAGVTAAKNHALTFGYSNADATLIANTARDSRTHVDTQMTAAAIETDLKYANWLESKAIAALKDIFDNEFDATEGIYIFHVEASHNHWNLQTSITTGLAHDFPTCSDTRCGFLQMCWNALFPCGFDKIAAHEIGHHLFLPHPPDTGECQDYKAHDKDVTSCLMSYNYATAMVLCGFCRLRLRGWSKDALDPDGTKNKKP